MCRNYKEIYSYFMYKLHQNSLPNQKQIKNKLSTKTDINQAIIPEEIKIYFMYKLGINYKEIYSYFMYKIEGNTP